MTKRNVRRVSYIAICILLIAFFILSISPVSAEATETVPDSCGVCADDYVNGFCSCENGYQPVVKNADGAYEIANAGQLYSFVKLVNECDSEEDITFNAIITADITVNSKVTENGSLVSDTSELREWVPIVNSSNITAWEKITVNIDGNGKIISGLYGIEGDMGLLGYPYNPCTITRLGIVDSYFDSGYCGSFLGDDNGGSNIIDCFSTAIISGGKYCGGIVGNSESDTKIENCYFGGKIVEHTCTGKNAITCNCYGDDTNITNCYYLDSAGVSSNVASAVTSEQVKSGFLTYRLNGGATDSEAVWRQTVGEGAPSYSGQIVYASEPCNSVFSNSTAPSSVEHSFVESRGYDDYKHWSSVCENCGDAEAYEDHSISTDTDLCSCGFLPNFKIVASNGDVSYVLNEYTFDVSDGSTVYCFKNITDKSVYVYGSDIIFDLNGKTAEMWLYASGNITFVDSSAEKTGATAISLSIYENDTNKAIFKGVTLLEDTYFYLKLDECVILDGVIISDPNIISSSNNKNGLKILSAEFTSGVSLYEGFAISDLLYGGGYLTDAEGNEIVLTEGQREIDAPFTVNTYAATVKIGETETEYNDLAQAFAEAILSEEATITLLRDYSPLVVKKLITEAGDNITFDLNGFDIYNTVIYAKPNSSIAITDTSADGDGRINEIAGITGIEVKGTLTISGTIINCDIYCHPQSVTIINGGTFNRGISVDTNAALTVNSGSFMGASYIRASYEDGETKGSISLKGGSYRANFYFYNMTFAEAVAENYLPKDADGEFIIDLSGDSLDKAFEIVAHTHSYLTAANGEQHWKECECGTIEPGNTKENHYGGSATLCEERKHCEKCNFEYGEAVPHDYNDGVVTTPPTCEGFGVKLYTCQNDASHTYTEDVDPIGHDYEDGVCAVCADKQSVKASIDGSKKYYYYDDLNELQAMLMYYEHETLDIILCDDQIAAEVRTLILPGGKISIDLAGYSIDGYMLGVTGAELTVKDSSADDSGAIIGENMMFVVLVSDGSRLVVDGGSIHGGIVSWASTDSALSSITVNGGKISGSIAVNNLELDINGGELTDIVFYISEEATNSSISIKGGKFTRVSALGTDDNSPTLADVFSSVPCVTYAVAPGSPAIDFTLAEYTGTFTASHDESHVNKESYKKNDAYHWFECENGMMSDIEAHTYGDGILCEKCGAKAPFTVEVNGKTLGFATLLEAFNFAGQNENAKITLNASGVLSVISGMVDIEYYSDITLDLNGFELTIEAYISLYNSSFTLTDSSTDKSGKVIGLNIDAYESSIILKNVSLKDCKIDIEYTYLELDGVCFKDAPEFDLYYSMPAVRSAVFEAGAMFNSDYDLGYIFGSECVTVTDADGKELVFEEEITEYNAKFRVVHEEEFTVTEWYGDGDGYHLRSCVFCSLIESREKCSSEGEVSCANPPTCKTCGELCGKTVSHKYDTGIYCTVCGRMAAFTVTADGQSWYFETALSAFEKADEFDTATIVLNMNYTDYDTEDVEIENADVIFDLNGYEYDIEEMNLYGGSITITDSSLAQSGSFYSDSTLDVYNGTLILEKGKYFDLYIDLDPDEPGYAAELVIKGGHFDYINIETDYEGDIFINILGGTFDDISFEIDDPANISVTGGAFYDIYTYDGGYLHYISEIIKPSGCVIIVDSNGRRITFDEEQYEYYGYVKVYHDIGAAEEPELNFGFEYHWYECECGLISEKEKHSGGTATCESLAVCEVCEEEYGSYAPHKYDENLKCTVCEKEASGNVKLVAGDYTEYFETLSEAIEYISFINKIVKLTLLGDVEEGYVNVYYVDIILDLNGFELDAKGIYIGDGKITVIDSSSNGSGKVSLSDGIYFYEGTVDIQGGSFKDTYIMLSTEYSGSHLKISGGSFKELYLTSFLGYSMADADFVATVEISSGKFDTLYIADYELMDVRLKGGEMIYGIKIYNEYSSRNMTLADTLPYACYSFVGEDGNRIDLSAKNKYLNYLKVVHTDTETLVGKENGHLYECLCGKSSEISEHVYDNACDASCNVCNAERSAAEHAYDNACDALCNVCNAERSVPEHVYDNDCDATCNVCQGTREAAHTFDSVEITEEPTHNEAGMGIATCSVCGVKETVVIPEKSGLPTVATVAISAGSTVAVLSGGFSLFWFVIRKKRVSNLIAK